MPRSLSPEQVNEQHVTAMGPALGPVYHALWNQVVWLHMKWHEFRELYGTKAERIGLLNSAAGLFFRVVQDVLWEETLLDIARLTDPPKSRGKANLTLQQLPPLIVDPSSRGRIVSLVDDAVVKAAFARDWRNRRIAHRDLALALKQGAKPLAGASRQQVDETLSAVDAVLNALSEQYLNSSLVFDHPFSEGSGAVALLYVLRDGLEVEEKRRTGRADPDDLRPPRAV